MEAISTRLTFSVLGQTNAGVTSLCQMVAGYEYKEPHQASSIFSVCYKVEFATSNSHTIFELYDRKRSCEALREPASYFKCEVILLLFDLSSRGSFEAFR